MFEDNTYKTILERMLSRVSDNVDKREGSVIFDTHSPTALEFQHLYIELERIIDEAYGDTASRDYLVLRCKERGIIPYEAQNALLKGVFTPDNIDVTGKRFNIDTLNYIALEKIEDGIYKVQCETAGISGNQNMGTMLPIDYIAGLETAELTEVLIPGEDEEDTEDLRKRYFASFEENSFGGNIKDYLEKTNAVQGVGSTKVTRVWNSDISPSSMFPSENVKMWYENVKDGVSEDVKQWLGNVYSAASSKKLTTGGTVLITILNSDYDIASDTLVKTVQQLLDPEENAGEGYGLAPIGHVVTVKSAIAVSIVVSTEIVFEKGYSWDNLQTKIDEAVGEYLEQLRKSWADTDNIVVRISQIETRILSIKGIIDIDKTKINQSSDNLTLDKYEVPILGGCCG